MCARMEHQPCWVTDLVLSRLLNIRTRMCLEPTVSSIARHWPLKQCLVLYVLINLAIFIKVVNYIKSERPIPACFAKFVKGWMQPITLSCSIRKYGGYPNATCWLGYLNLRNRWTPFSRLNARWISHLNVLNQSLSLTWHILKISLKL